MTADRIELPQPIVMTADEARALTDRIKGDLAGLLPLIRDAFERRADVALGYSSWAEYCDTELRGVRIPVQNRAEIVGELRSMGMSTRAIGSALGVSKDTIQRELASTVSGETVERPVQVKSLDGRERPATRPVSLEFSSAVRDAKAEHVAEQAQRASDRQALNALADELGLKFDPNAEAKESRRIALLYPFFDAVARLAAMPDPVDVAGQVRAHEAYHLDDLPTALGWLDRFTSQWKEHR